MKIVIDTETTGLVAGEDELLQISIIDEYGVTLYNQYLKPTRATSWLGAERVNHITPAMVQNAPTISEELPTIQTVIDQADTIIGYNTPFDIKFLQAAGILISDDIVMIDVMRDFAPIYGEWSEQYGDYKWQKLINCAAYYKYDWESDTAHDSLADCRATLWCYWKMFAVC